MKRVLVTGASKGIGFAIATQSGLDGFDVVVHYNRDETGAEECAREIRLHGGSASLVSFDISNREQTREVLEREIEENGPYYGVVCNAGIVADNAFPSLTSENWDSVIRTNLDGFYNVVHPLVMPMVKRREPGRIITLSSLSGEIGNRGQVNYSASKAGLIGATKALAIELAKRKITVNCVSPGIIESEMGNKAPWERIKESVPLRRMGRPEEVADLVSFLLSDKSSYITRQVISINGGIA